jgi:HSP20 family protein
VSGSLVKSSTCGDFFRPTPGPPPPGEEWHDVCTFAHRPGLKPEEFDVELKDNQLWITGERKQEEEQHGKTWHRIERHYGQFRRVIPLETAVEAEKVAAEYTDGVLRISVPKSEAVRPRRIEVKS